MNFLQRAAPPLDKFVCHLMKARYRQLPSWRRRALLMSFRGDGDELQQLSRSSIRQKEGAHIAMNNASPSSLRSSRPTVRFLFGEAETGPKFSDPSLAISKSFHLRPKRFIFQKSFYGKWLLRGSVLVLRAPPFNYSAKSPQMFHQFHRHSLSSQQS